MEHAAAKTTLSICAHLSQEYELQNAEKLNAVFTKVSKQLQTRVNIEKSPK